MPTIADALRRFAPAYLQQHAESVSIVQQKVLGAIVRCRSGALGGVQYQWSRCDGEHWVGREWHLIGVSLMPVRVCKRLLASA
jgi:hypothetical protein